MEFGGWEMLVWDWEGNGEGGSDILSTPLIWRKRMKMYQARQRDAMSVPTAIIAVLRRP